MRPCDANCTSGVGTKNLTGRASMNAGRTALEGIRVLDVTQVMAGPFCAMQLCDMGADVIKVEPPGGDSTRRMAGASGDDSAGFNAVNRGKRGIVLDLGTPRGQDAMRRLLASADILIENYRPGVMRRFGLDYATLAAAVSGADLRVDLRIRTDRARRGERRLRPDRAGRVRADVGHRRTGQAAGQGRRAADRSRRRAVRAGGDPGGAPLPHPNRARPAHRHVARRGRDRAVGVGIGRVLRPGRPAGAARIGASHARALPGHPLCRRLHHAGGRNRSPVSAPLRGARAPGVDRRPCLRERYAPGSQPRGAHRADRGDDHRGASRHGGWRASRRRGSPAGRSTTTPRPSPIRRSVARGMVVDVDHPTLGRLRTLGSPIKMSATPPVADRRAPLLGEHTRETLREAGCTESEIRALMVEGGLAV